MSSLSKQPRQQQLRIPELMRTMQTAAQEEITGGKRRENSLAWRMAYGLTFSLYVGPAGFVLALL